MLNRERLSQIDNDALISLTLQQGEVIRKQESQIQKLLDQLNKQNQASLFDKDLLNKYKNLLFGKSSEKRTSSSEYKPKKKREKFGYTEQANLPVIEVNHEVPEEEQVCDNCGSKLHEWEGQFEESELIQVVPTSYVIEKHKRQKYICNCGKSIVTAKGPLKLKEGSRYSIEFGTEVGVAKYQYHLPLERQRIMMQEYGLDVKSQTLFSQIDTIAWYLKPHVYENIKEHIKSSDVFLADETTWGNLGKDAKSKYYLWGLRSKEAVYFLIQKNRSQSSANEFLKDLKGILVSDGYSVYQQVSDDLENAFCWAHVRRKFVESESSFPEESAQILELIKQLYKTESKIKDKPPDERLEVRKTKSRQITEKLKEKLKSLSTFLPGTSLRKAVDYTLNLWSGLTVFINNSDVPVDNNEMERTIRGSVVGRKNHYGSKTLNTAQVAAVWYSVVETCKTNNINPRIYILSALRDILSNRKPKMPWDFKDTNTEN
jgi:transposase